MKNSNNDLEKRVDLILNDIVLGLLDEDDPESTMTAKDYIKTSISIEYIVDDKKDYLGARILMEYGGPTIWINTRSMTVEGSWLGNSFTGHYYHDEMDLCGACRKMFNRI